MSPLHGSHPRTAAIAGTTCLNRPWGRCSSVMCLTTNMEAIHGPRAEGAVDGHANVHRLRAVSTQPTDARASQSGNVAGRNCITRSNRVRADRPKRAVDALADKERLDTGTGSGRRGRIVDRAQGGVAQSGAPWGSLVVSNNIGCRCRSIAVFVQTVANNDQVAGVRGPIRTYDNVESAEHDVCDLRPGTTKEGGVSVRIIGFRGASERQRVARCGRQVADRQRHRAHGVIEGTREGGVGVSHPRHVHPDSSGQPRRVLERHRLARVARAATLREARVRRRAGIRRVQRAVGERARPAVGLDRATGAANRVLCALPPPYAEARVGRRAQRREHLVRFPRPSSAQTSGR